MKDKKKRREYDRMRQQDGRNAQYLSERLAKGDQIQNYGQHHYGMAKLKEKRGEPRPKGMTLSLINPEGPDSYWGYFNRNGEKQSYRLSSNPDDYVWEADGENKRRRNKI